MIMLIGLMSMLKFSTVRLVSSLLNIWVSLLAQADYMSLIGYLWLTKIIRNWIHGKGV